VWSTFPDSFATTVFLLIQPSTMFPIANEMKKPQDFTFCCTLAYVAIVIMDLIFATLVFLLFGNATQELVLSNLCGIPCTGTIALIAQSAIIMSVFFTYPYVMTAATDVIEYLVLGEPKDRIPGQFWKNMIIRALCNIVACLFAVCVPNIDDLLNITSGIALTYNGFVMGPIIFLKQKYTKGDSGATTMTILLISHILLLLLGIVLGIWATVLAIQNVISDY